MGKRVGRSRTRARRSPDLATPCRLQGRTRRRSRPALPVSPVWIALGLVVLLGGSSAAQSRFAAVPVGEEWQLPSPTSLTPRMPVPAAAPALLPANTPPVAAPMSLPNRVIDRQGARVVLGGTAIALPWVTWREGDRLRVGMSDMGWRQATGVELLDTRSPGQQPVRWFSPFDQTLSAQFVNGLRYLDITDWIAAYQGQGRVQGSDYVLDLPLATLQRVRRGNLPGGGSRYVFDLDRPATFQVIADASQVTIALNAQGSGSLRQALNQLEGGASQAGTGNLASEPAPINDAQLPDDPGAAAAKADPAAVHPLQAAWQALVHPFATSPTAPPPVPVQLSGNRAIATLPIPSGQRINTFTLVEPARLVVDVRPDLLPTRDLQWAQGIRWRQQWLPLGSARFAATWLELDPRAQDLELRPISPQPNTQTGIAPVLTTAQVNGASAAINGGFFNRNNQLPLGAVRVAGEWRSGPILDRGAVGWSDWRRPVFGRLRLQETVRAGDQTWPLTHLNSGYVQAGLARYTRAWGPGYRTLTDNEVGIVVQGDRVVQQVRGAAAGASTFPIPESGYLLVARSFQTAANALPVGRAITRQSATNPPDFADLPHILAAGPLLVSQGQIVLNAAGEGFSDAFIQQRASRSAIGVLPDGRWVVVAVHARSGGPGPSLGEMAQLMRSLGTIQALNLDGGSSTSLALGGVLIDRAPRTAARVHGALGLFGGGTP